MPTHIKQTFYTYNPHYHVKIWLSQDPCQYLNLTNQLRLIKMRAKNPGDIIYLIYDSALFTTDPHQLSILMKELLCFCEKHTLIPRDVRIDVIPKCTTLLESNLIQVYEDNIKHLGEAGGNVGTASDILRWLAPVYELGTYTDFDVAVDTSHLPRTIFVERPLLANIGGVYFKNGMKSLSFNNDILAIVKPEAMMPLIRFIQQSLFDACRVRLGTSPYMEFIEAFHRDAFSLFASPITLPQKFDSLYKLHSMNQQSSAREMRAAILLETNNNEVFCASMGYTESSFFRALKEKSSKYADPSLDESSMITRLRNKDRELLLKNSVVYTTGPGRVGGVIFLYKHFRTAEGFEQIVSPYAFSYTKYGMPNSFVSKNSCPLHISSEDYQKELEGSCLGKTCDASWLQAGQDLLLSEEAKMPHAAIKIQSFFKQTQRDRKSSQSTSATLGSGAK